MKIRGLACHRDYTQPFIKAAQEEVLAILAQAQTLEELHQLRQEAVKIVDARTAELESDTVDPRQLLIEQVLNCDVEDYSAELVSNGGRRDDDVKYDQKEYLDKMDRR